MSESAASSLGFGTRTQFVCIVSGGLLGLFLYTPTSIKPKRLTLHATPCHVGHDSHASGYHETYSEYSVKKPKDYCVRRSGASQTSKQRTESEAKDRRTTEQEDRRRKKGVEYLTEILLRWTGEGPGIFDFAPDQRIIWGVGGKRGKS